jgi:hypothetical protein
LIRNVIQLINSFIQPYGGLLAIGDGNDQQ